MVREESAPGVSKARKDHALLLLTRSTSLRFRMPLSTGAEDFFEIRRNPDLRSSLRTPHRDTLGHGSQFNTHHPLQSIKARDSSIE